MTKLKLRKKYLNDENNENLLKINFFNNEL